MIALKTAQQRSKAEKALAYFSKNRPNETSVFAGIPVFVKEEDKAGKRAHDLFDGV
jgi:hypothetical protein